MASIALRLAAALWVSTGWMSLALVLLAPAAASAQEQPVHRISAAQLQEAVERRFPLRYGMSGLLDVTVRAPLLRMLPQLDRVAADMVVVVAGPALARSVSGEFALDFALRYERRDQTVRAHRLRVRSQRVPGLPQPYPELLDGFAQALADEALGEVVLHRLGPQDLALADVMGLEPDTITVTAQGLAIGFAPKPPR